MLPLNPEARKIADSWDLAKAKADPDQCKAYGPPALMRVPGRLNIHWTDDNTLQLDTDSGTQTRVFRFGAAASPAGQAPQLQGYSVASWEFLGARGRGAGVPKGTGQLRVRTTQMSGGYLRRNGVPYSENATLDEVLRHVHRAQRRHLARGHVDRERSQVPDRSLRVDRALQEDPGSGGMGSHTLQGRRTSVSVGGHQ